jgi:hypothetical protein
MPVLGAQPLGPDDPFDQGQVERDPSEYPDEEDEGDDDDDEQDPLDR